MDVISEMDIRAMITRASNASNRYGRFTSTHEALGVLTEEIRELEDAIRANAMASVMEEALDVAAVAMRLAEHARVAMDRELPAFNKRSGCV